MTRLWLILLLAGASLSSGCASIPTPDPWAAVDVASEPAQRPLDPGSFPLPSDVGADQVIYDATGVRQLEAYRVTAEGNYVIGLEHAAQIDQLRTAASDLIEAGKAQRRVAELRQEILLEERRHHAWEKITLYTGMLLIIGASAL